MIRKESVDIGLEEPTSSRQTIVEVEEHLSKEESTNVLKTLWFFPRVLTVMFFAVLFVWIYQAEGGFGFDEATLFGWHALLMALFVVLFTQESVLAYTAPLFLGPISKPHRSVVGKWFHVICHVLGIISAMLGITAIVYYKNLSPQPPAFPFYAVYSPHSWLGITVLILWGIQLVAGLYVHLYQPQHNRYLLVKMHRFFGCVVYIAGLATCALGLQDMQSSDLASSTPPIPGNYDTMSMGGQTFIFYNNQTINVTGYYPDSPEAQYSSACTILLLFLGITTIAPLVFRN